MCCLDFKMATLKDFLSLWMMFFFSFRLESKSTHEIREAYDVTSMDVGFDNKEHPEFFNSIHRILPELSELSRRLLRCLAIALGTTDIIRMFKFQSSFQFYTENGIQLT